jgi:mono/diheme cytochrome c family protein/glucose/arabinose dehydrogenase
MWTAIALLALQDEPNRGGTIDLSSTDPDVAIQSFTLPEGYVIELVASEREFPELANPVSLVWDGSNRLLVACMPSYPMVDPGQPSDDYVLALEDTDGDGRMDRAQRFVDGLACPTGLEVGHGGLYVVSQPDILFVRDTDGDGVADTREVPLVSFATTDTHHATSAFGWSPDGGLLFAEGVFHTSQIETPTGVVRNKDAAVFRWEPRRARLEVHTDYHFMNPWGQVFDERGRFYIADASGGANLYGTQLTGRVEWPGRHPGIQSFTSIVRPTAGAELVATRAFPADEQGDFLVANCIGFRGIKQHRVIHDGAGVSSVERQNLLSSSDPNFRPVDLRFGPDGALYIVDWFNPLIGHMQYSLFDDRRDRGHGRIWRIRHLEGELVEPLAVAELPVDGLLEALREPENRTRYRARRELWARDVASTAARAAEWARGEDDGLALEALWVQCGLHAVDPELLERCLTSDEAAIRAAATKALRWAYPEPGGLLSKLERAVGDEDALVRLEALAALSWRDEPEAAAIALGAVDSSLEDRTLRYVFDEALRVLREPLLEAFEAGRALDVSEAGMTALFASLSTARLRELSPSKQRDTALLRRGDAPVGERRAALARLASDATVDEALEVTRLFEALDDADDYAALAELEGVLFEEAARLAGDGDLVERLARHRLRDVRRLAWRLRIEAGESADALLADASSSATRLADLLGALAVRGVADPAWRAPLAELLDASESVAPPTLATRLRLTVPGEERIINISEVEVFADDVNVALGGKASSSSVDWDGPPEAGVDGVITGNFAPKRMVHTNPERDPWFEVEWELPAAVREIRVWNRTEPPYGERLEGFELVLFDAAGAEVWRRESIPAPGATGVYPVDLPGGGVPRTAVLRALGVVAPDALEPSRLLAWLEGPDLPLAQASEEALLAVPSEALLDLELDPLAARLTGALAEATWDDRFTERFDRRLTLARRLGELGEFAALEAALAEEAGMPSLARYTAGREHYAAHCAACHQEHGRGIAGAYPPLAGSSWLLGDPRRPARIALHGLQGEIDVDGVAFRGAMAPLGPLLDDQELADLLTYARNAWGNAADAVTPELVAAERRAAGNRRSPWTARELDADPPR